MHSSILRCLFWLTILLITCLALWPLQSPPLTESHADKINHVAAFVALALLLRAAYRLSLLQTALLLLGYGLLIEVVQAVIPFRMFSLLDLTADGVGIVVGSGLFVIGYSLLGKIVLLLLELE
jgi:VanZ family protein